MRKRKKSKQNKTKKMLLLDSCRPRFYSRFHQRTFLSALVYLVQLLAVYEIVRWFIFIGRHKEIIDGLSTEKCMQELVDVFPDGLQIQVRNERFYYNQFTPIVIKVPNCITNGLGLLASYMSHGALRKEEMWYVVAPYVVLLDNDEQLENAVDFLDVSKQKDRYFEAALLSIGREDAYVFDAIPAAPVLQRMIQAFSDSDGEGKYVSMDKNSLMKVLEEVKAENTRRRKRKLDGDDDEEGDVSLDQALAGLLLVGSVLLCGFLVSVVASFDLLITSTLLYVLVRKGWLKASFWLWSIKKHYSSENVQELFTDEELQEEQEHLIRNYVEQQQNNNNDPGGVFVELYDSFFVGLAIHAATPAIFLDAMFPYPIGNIVGIGVVAHMIYTVFVVRYYALPGVLIDRYFAAKLVQRRTQQRLRRIREEVDAMTGGEGSSSRTSQIPRLSSLSREMERASSVVRTRWAHFVNEQRAIEATLRSETMSLKTKLTTVVSKMQSLRERIYGPTVNILHVWSTANTGEYPSGGPGWCYGLSLSSGSWVLLCWYDHPCSEMGINALVAYPGLVCIANDDEDSRIPKSLLPTQREIDTLQSNLNDLKRNFKHTFEKKKV